MVAFANANLLNIARTTPNFRDTLNEFLVLNDGIALDLASRAIHGRTFPDNLNGTDFIPSFFVSTVHQLRVFILGGAPGIAQTSLQKLALTYPRHTFVGAHSGFEGGYCAGWHGKSEAGAVAGTVICATPDARLDLLSGPLSTSPPEMSLEHRRFSGRYALNGCSGLRLSLGV